MKITALALALSIGLAASVPPAAAAHCTEHWAKCLWKKITDGR